MAAATNVQVSPGGPRLFPMFCIFYMASLTFPSWLLLKFWNLEKKISPICRLKREKWQIQSTAWFWSPEKVDVIILLCSRPASESCAASNKPELDQIPVWPLVMSCQDGGPNKLLRIFKFCLFVQVCFCWPWHGHGCGCRRQDDQVLLGGRVQGGLHVVILCNLSFVNSHRSPTVIGHTILIDLTLIKIKILTWISRLDTCLCGHCTMWVVRAGLKGTTQLYCANIVQINTIYY